MVGGSVEETRFLFSKLRLTTVIRTRPGELGLRIHDEVENLAGQQAEAQLLYHINFGPPLLDAGAKVIAPVKTLAPRDDHAAAGVTGWDSYEAETPGFEEQVYFLELLGDQRGETHVLLKNAHSARGVSLRFNVEQLPCFTIWKNTAAADDGYVTGLEPGVNYPNPRSFEGRQGRVLTLPPGGKAAFDLQLTLHQNDAEVAAAEKQIADLQAGGQPMIHDRPQPALSAGA